MIIVLKDKQTLEDEMMISGRVINGLECEVEEIYHLSETNNLIDWEVFKLKNSPLIYVKRTGDTTDHFVYCKPNGISFGSKKDWLEQGHNWLFTDDNFNKVIYQDGEPFNMIGSYVCDKNGINSLVVEWSANDDVLNPRLLCIEIGNLGIEFYQGCKILENEVEFL